MIPIARPILLLLFALAGCGGPPPPPPAVLALTLSGGADQNPDPAGKPNSVAIHVYQLTGTGKFDNADVFALLDKEKATLGDEAAASETVFLAPGATVSINEPLKPGVTALGMVAAFRDIDHATWRVKAPVKPSGPTKLEAKTAGIVLTLKPAAPAP
ncbi:MAG: type VI secretion system lipoprotein TssJ [Acetobacteraceae bacterium]|nr:type VI secretion system lipoprotein TssJ [Acetobacteraceae bacterium]